MGHGLQKQGDLGLPFPDNAPKVLTNGFRAEPDLVNDLRRHLGIDWGLPPGTPVCAMYDGKVDDVVTNRHVRGADPYQVLDTNGNPGLANRVYVLSDTGGGNGFQSRYGHLSQVFVGAGQFVRKGDLLGLSGHTGWSSGPHLHVEFRPCTTDTTVGDPADFKDFLPPGYNINTSFSEPNASRKVDDNDVAQVIRLYRQPVGSSLIGTLSVPGTPTWLNSEGTDDTGNSILSVGEGTFSLSLTGNTVTFTVTGVSFDGTNNGYVAVGAGSLPANLRPPIRIAKHLVTDKLPDHRPDSLYVSQNGKIYHRNSRATNSDPNEAPTISLSWPLAYSVIGKDGPTASWWQIVVPGLDPAGVVGWVPKGDVTVTDPGSLVQVTWPPPPRQLRGFGIFLAYTFGQAEVNLNWQAPEDLWTGTGSNYGGGYRILRGSSSKTLTDHATTDGLSWTENINVNDGFHYAVAGVAGTGTSLRSLATTVEAGSNTLSPLPPGPSIGTLKVNLVLNVRSGPGIGYRKIGSLARGATVNVLGDNGELVGTGRWWQIQWPGREAWVNNGPAGDGAYVKYSEATNDSDETAVLPLGTGAIGSGPGHPLDGQQDPPVGGLYARLGLSAGGDVLRRWPTPDAATLTATLQAEVWYTVRRLFARTGLGDLWLEVQPHSAIPSGTASGAAGWVPLARMVLAAQGTPVLPPSARFVRLQSWVTAGANVRSGPDTAYTPVLRTLTDRSAWYRLEGQNATPATWYRLEYTADSYGWVYAGLLDVIEPVRIPLTALPIQQASSRPAAEPAPTGETASGTTATAGSAQGDFRNLATNPDGRWAVSKTGRTAALSFDCPRSPVQYYARQNPQPQFVLPAAFRPTSTVTQTVTGTEVDANRVDLAGSPSVTFTVRIETDGEVRYVNNSQVDHVGYVRYGVRALAYATATELEQPAAPMAGDISDSGTYLNRQVNWGSRWELERSGNDVEGSFSCTRSPVEYYANGDSRAAQLLLPTAYRPTSNARFRVTGAVRVNEDGTDSTDARRVNFWITMQPNGEMWLDADSSLETQGVGYVRYTVEVDWTAPARLTVPSVPRELEVEEIEAEEVELDWRSPATSGGARVDEYRVEEYRYGRWRTAEDEITRTRYTLEDLDPYTRYSFRVRAHNSVGWSEPSPALTVTTLRQAPGRPGRPTETATHAQVALSWSAPTSGGGVTGYRIQRRVGSGSWQTQVADTGATVPGWTDRTVSAATGYDYRVAAYNYGELGAWSSTRSVTTAATPTVPGQVTTLAVAPGTTRRLALSWTAPSDTGGGVSGYQVERAPDATPRAWATLVADTGSATPSWGDDAVAADTVVHYRVSACNSAGVGTASAEARGHSRPQLRLQRQAVYPLAAHSEPRPDAPVTATFTAYQPGQTYELVGQVPGTAGWWQLQLLDPAVGGPGWVPAATGRAAGSTTALPAPPAAPGDFTATLASGEVSLSWTAPSSGSTVTGYRLWRQTDAGTFTQLGTDLAATGLTHTDSTVQNGHVYRYWVQGLADAGPGVPSPTVALAVLATLAAPDAVTALTATATTIKLALSWTQATTGGLPTGYRVAWRESATDDFYWEVRVTGPSHTLTHLIPGTSYELRVTASNQEGDAAVTTGTGTTVQVAPGDPTALTVQVASNTATVNWTAPETGGRPDEYHLQSKTPATAIWAETYTTVTANTHILRDLAYETGYEVQVRASNTAGQSAWVSTPFTSGRARPSAVQELTAAPADDSQMALSWQTPLATAGGISGYRIERAADVEPRVWVEQVADTGTPATTWADSGLTADTVVHYRVTGRNAEGLGDSTTAQGRTRPRLALNATATYPLTAHAWPLATAPVTHTWTAHDATVALDVRGQAPGWWRVVRYGQGASGPYWLPARAATVTGTTTDLPAAPGVPGDLALQASHDRVTLTWTAPPTGGPVTGYRLWRQSGEAAFSVVETALAAAALSHTDTTVSASTAYQYRLQAVSAAGYGLRTAAVGITTAETPRVPGQVTDLTAAPTAESQMSLSWTEPGDAGTQPLTGYQVARAPDAEPRVWITVVTDTGTTDLTWADRGLPASTVYHYRVSARSRVGGGTASAAASGTTRPQLTLLATAPYPLTAHQWPAATAPVTHTWSAHDASVSLDLVGQGAGGGGWWRGLRFGHAASGPYWLPAAAVGTQGSTSDLPQVPGAPTDLATSATADAVTLSWSAPTTGGTVTGYRLWRQSGEAAFSVQGDDLAADALTYKDTAVAASTTYQYRLQARAAVGPGLRTAAVSATTPAAPAPGVPAAVACNYRNGRVTVYWDPPPTGGPVTHYLLWQQIDSGTWAVTGDPVATGRSYYSYRFAAPADADTLAYEVQAVGPGGAGPRSDTTSLIVPS